MKQQAVITEIKNDTVATITVLRKSACSACSARHACGSAKKTVSTVNNKIGAKVGDTVEIEVPSENVLGYSALVFLAPVFLALILYMILAPKGEIYGIIGAAVGFVLPFTVAFFVSKANAEKVRPTVTAILEGTHAEPDGDSGCDLRK